MALQTLPPTPELDRNPLGAIVKQTRERYPRPRKLVMRELYAKVSGR